MSWVAAIVWAMAAGALALDVWATLQLAKSALFTPGQRVAHTVTIWLFPFVGALVMLSLMNEESRANAQRQEEKPEPNEYVLDALRPQARAATRVSRDVLEGELRETVTPENTPD